MSRRPTEAKQKPKLEVDHELTKAATGSDNPELGTLLMKQVTSAIWLPDWMSEEDLISTARASFAMLKGIQPSDELEGMLAAQMVATHNAALECFRRAMLPEQTFQGRDSNLKSGTKLAALYTRQMDALNKHRGKGQQKVTVEHVHVEAGGQAIVGNIDNRKDREETESQHTSKLKTISQSDDKTTAPLARKRKKVKQPRSRS